MPHVTIQYTANLDPEATDGRALRQPRRGDLRPARRRRAAGSTRSAAPACSPIRRTTFAVADGAPDRAFVYLNVRIAPGREPARVKATGEALIAAVRSHFETLFASRPLGITLQIDEGAPVFDVKHSNLHPLFAGK